MIPTCQDPFIHWHQSHTVTIVDLVLEDHFRAFIATSLAFRLSVMGFRDEIHHGIKMKYRLKHLLPTINVISSNDHGNFNDKPLAYY